MADISRYNIQIPGNSSTYTGYDVTYERTDGSGTDHVFQLQKDGQEIAHRTEHPDGTIHEHGYSSSNSPYTLYRN